MNNHIIVYTVFYQASVPSSVLTPCQDNFLETLSPSHFLFIPHIQLKNFICDGFPDFNPASAPSPQNVGIPLRAP